MTVGLRAITDENRDEVLALRVAPSQTRFVGTSRMRSPTQGRSPKARGGWYRAVYADDVPVGVRDAQQNVVPQPPRIIGPWYLWKLLVDERHQGRGYGREAVKLVAHIVRENGATELLTSCVQTADGPEAFYRRLGFRPTGQFDADGEVILALELT